jgi:predicted aldo/keto reductase-like oxidoreductase
MPGAPYCEFAPEQDGCNRATRFALSHPAMGTILVGMAAPQQFEDALDAIQKARWPLPRSTG